MNIKEMFNEFATVYSRKIDEEYSIKLQFEITDVEEDNFWQIDVSNGKVNLYTEDTIEPEEYFVMKAETLTNLYFGKISPLTAYANEPDETGEMCGLIDLKYKTKDKFNPSYGIIPEHLSFVQRLHKFNEFFDKKYPTTVYVKNDSCRILHGVDAIGLYSKIEEPYDKGILHVYFSIKKNEVLKLAPIQHSIYVLKGSGLLIMDGEEYSLNPNEYYRLTPKTKEKLLFKNYNIEPLEILYI